MVEVVDLAGLEDLEVGEQEGIGSSEFWEIHLHGQGVGLRNSFIERLLY